MENEELVLQIKAGINISENMEQLYLQNQNFIYSMAKRYSSYAEIDDLMQEAYLALVIAVDRFDPERGNKFLTYFSFGLQAKLQRYIESSVQIKRIPSYLQIRIRKYQTLLAKCATEGRTVTDSDICRNLNITERQLHTLRRIIAESQYLSLNEPLPGSDNLTIEEAIPDPFDLEEEITDKLSKQQLSEQLWKIVDGLGRRESAVITDRYKNSATLKDIGKRLNLSGERIRRIEITALRVLGEKRELRAIAESYEYWNSGSLAYKGSFRRFKDRGCSSTEYLALKRIEIQEKREQKQNSIDELFEQVMNLASQSKEGNAE